MECDSEDSLFMEVEAGRGIAGMSFKLLAP
jgi:hypothetical protein